MILPSECRALGEGAITTYFKCLRFDAAGMSGARIHDLPFAKREHDHKATATGKILGKIKTNSLPTDPSLIAFSGGLNFFSNQIPLPISSLKSLLYLISLKFTRINKLIYTYIHI
jgi:hypothetical protein